MAAIDQSQQNAKAQLAQGIVHSVELMISKGAIKIDLPTYRVLVNTELFWLGKSDKWRTRFAKNMLAYLHANDGQDPDKLTPDMVAATILIFDIDNGWPLGAYSHFTGYTYAEQN